MSKSFWISLLLLLPAGPAAAAEGLPYSVFPRSEELFRPLLADPRHIQLGASYYRLNRRNLSDVALGHSWGMARWFSSAGSWAFQSNIEAMAYSRFELAGSVNEFETVDFFANLPIEIRRGRFSSRVMLFHESSHLGDDYIRRTGDAGFRYSIDGLRSVAALEPTRWLRVYGGPTFLLHTIPSPKRWMFQSGLELVSDDLGWLEKYPTRLYIAQDAVWRQNVDWRINARTVVGLRIGFKGTLRSARVYVGHYTGRSPYGQFFRQREKWSDLGIRFDL